MKHSHIGRPFAALLVVAAGANAQDTTLVSVSDAGLQGDRTSGSEGVEAVVDEFGHLLVIFASYATNLVPGDTNGVKDLFLRDVTDGLTTRLVMGLNGAEPDGDSRNARVTPDGRLVAFDSSATNLVAGDTNGETDVFVLDRTSGVIERVSLDVTGRECDDFSHSPSISDDGRFVSFYSLATDLMKSGVDQNGEPDVFVRDRKTATNYCASLNGSGRTGDGPSYTTPASGISADGQYVLFSSEATDLVAGDTNGVRDAFVCEQILKSPKVTRVSVDASGAELAQESWAMALSNKASIALFSTQDPDVLPGFSNGTRQLYAYAVFDDEVLAAATRHDGTALQADDYYMPCAIAGDDGSDFDALVAFVTAEDEVTPGDGDGVEDLYVRRLRGGDLQQASIGSDGSPSVTGYIFSPSLTPGGRHLALMTEDPFAYPVDTSYDYDVYVRGIVWTLFTEFGVGLAGSGGHVPHLHGRGGSCETAGHSIHLDDGLGGAFGLLWIGLGTKDQTLFGGHFYVDFASFFLPLPILLGGASGVAGDGSFDLDGSNTESMVPLTVYLQCTLVDPAAPKKVSLTNALEVTLTDEAQ